MRRTVGVLVGTFVLFASLIDVHANRLTLNGDWNRFVTKDGRDISIRLKKDTDGRYRGRVILGHTDATGDRGVFKGGAHPHVIDLFVEGRNNLVLKGETRDGTRYSIGFGKDRIKVRLHRGFLKWPRTLYSGSNDDFRTASTSIDRTPLTGAAAAEMYDHLRGLGAPAGSTTYRGLYVFPDRVSLDAIEVPAQLIDALNGLRSSGLRLDHPIFTRQP